MSRSLWKGVFLKKYLLENNNNNKKKIWSRESSIPFFLLGTTITIHDGKTFKKVYIDRQKVGYKFGSFVLTRKHTKKFKLKKINGPKR